MGVFLWVRYPCKTPSTLAQVQEVVDWHKFAENAHPPRTSLGP